LSEWLLCDRVARFRSILGNELGLAFEEERLGQLAEVLSERASRLGSDIDGYLDQLERSPSRTELSNIARRVTVAETYFFRHRQQFDALAAILIEQYSAASPPRLLSAGCASGEEAYSLVMTLRELWPSSVPVVVAADLNPENLERARAGRYSEWSLRETPAFAISRWFHREGREYVIDDAIRRSVRFVQSNFAHDEAELLSLGSFDIIFCRNVLMYFTPESYRAAVRRLSRSLVPEGYLFLGSAETLRGVSQDYHLCHTHGAFYYRLKGERELSQRPALLEQPPRAWREPVPPEPDLTGSAWVEEIARAAARVAALGDGNGAARAPHADGSTRVRRGLDLSRAHDLLHAEQFSDALAHVRALPDAARDPEAMLLEALLLSSAGKLGDAEQVCQRLLEVDELNAGAHYVLALCDAGAGKTERAVYHDRVAAYLDPAFAMPRLHLGLLLRRAGDRAAARIELGQARSLLQREDAARLLMFGGGFSRTALLGLCNAELELTGDGA
jgi:chemotaxis protein methyltransferase CheR